MYFIDTIFFIFYFILRCLGKKFPLKHGLSDTKFKKILIVRLDHIGDVMMTTPIIKALKNKYTEARIDLLVGSWAKRVVEDNPYVDTLYIYDAPWWANIRPGEKRENVFSLSHIRRLYGILSVLRKQKYDLMIEPRGDFRHLLLFGYFANVRYILSFDRSGGRYLLSEVVSFDENQNEMEKNSVLLSVLGICNVDKKVDIYVSKEEENRAKALLERNGILGKKIVIFSVGSRKHLKRWPIDKFLSLASWIVETYLDTVVIFVGSSADRFLSIEIKKGVNLGKVYDFIGMTDIKEVMALLRMAALIVANDGPVSHMCSSVNTPAIILFGPTQAERFRPYGEHITVVQKIYDCCPCLLVYCKHTNSESISACMQAIEVDDICNIIKDKAFLIK